MSEPIPSIPLRFQKLELRDKADLSAPAQSLLANAAGPSELIAALSRLEDRRDAISALALMLPRRQAVWWGALAARLAPDLARRGSELAAIEAAEAWVQSGGAAECDRAHAAAQACGVSAPAHWVAMAAYWSGDSIAPRGQQAVPPAPHLPGVATRTAMISVHDPVMKGRLRYEDLLAIGVELMGGELGRRGFEAARLRLAEG